MGGGGWSSSSSSSSSSGGWSSHDSGGWSSSGGGGGGGGGAGTIAICLVLIGVCLVAGFVMSLHDEPTPRSVATRSDAVDVSVLRVALDGRARKFVQTELARIAKTANGATPAGRLAMVRECAMLLRRLRDAWVYGGAINVHMSPMMNAKQIYDHHVTETRAKFRHETVSNVQGTYVSLPAGDEYIPRSHEGSGVILVSIIIATRTELFTVLHIGDGEHLRQALDSLNVHAADDIVAVDVVWQPSEDADRMSSMELEAKYPAPFMMKFPNALAGKTFCEYCAGPFPAELVSCPHCGAPSARSVA